MSSRLTEIEALIEAEVEVRVEARLAQRMGALAHSLRAMANRVDPAYKPLEVSMPPGTYATIAVPAAVPERAEAEEDAEPSTERQPDEAAALAGVDPPRRTAPVSAQPPAPRAVDPPADGLRADYIPEGSPDWLAPALARLRPQKEKSILLRIAKDGGVTLQEVIYHFRPAIKETYATVILSNVRSALKAGGMALERDAEGVYRVRADT